MVWASKEKAPHHVSMQRRTLGDHHWDRQLPRVLINVVHGSDTRDRDSEWSVQLAETEGVRVEHRPVRVEVLNVVLSKRFEHRSGERTGGRIVPEGGKPVSHWDPKGKIASDPYLELRDGLHAEGEEALEADDDDEVEDGGVMGLPVSEFGCHKVPL
jgi:hypothetical protein